jgi:phosphatidylglycerophosphatase A
MKWLSIATLGPIGYLPAPGTWGTIATVPLVYLLHTCGICYAGALLIILLCAFISVDRAVRVLHHADPSCVVIDECVGTLVTFIGMPINIPVIVVGVILFRLFDITKWCGIWRCQQLPSAWGVIMDDVVAGIISCVLLHLLHLQGLL